MPKYSYYRLCILYIVDNLFSVHNKRGLMSTARSLVRSKVSYWLAAVIKGVGSRVKRSIAFEYDISA